MAALLTALRRLFPPLLVKRKLLVFVVLLAVYGWVVYELVEIEHLPHIDWGAESTIMNGLVLGFLLSFRNNTPMTVGGKPASSGASSSTRAAISV